MQFDINQVLRVDPKMYRHFAIATVAISICVALFANTDNQQAIAGELAKRDQKVALKVAEAKKMGPRALLENNAPIGPDMLDDAPPTVAEARDRGWGAAAARPGLKQACGREAADRTALTRMSEPQREAYLAKLDEMDCAKMAPDAAPVQPSQQQINALAEASAARSGASSID